MTESTERPFAVTVLAVIAGIATILGIGAALGRPDAARPLIDDLAALRVGTGLTTTICLAIAVVNAVLAYGYWTMRAWAWPIGVAVVGVAVVLDLAALVTASVIGLAAVAGLGVHAVLFAYLVTPETRQMFGATSHARAIRT